MPSRDEQPLHEEFRRVDDLGLPVRMLAHGSVVVTGIVIICLALLTITDIVGRKLGVSGVAGTVEFSEVGLVIVALGGLVVAEVDRVHIRSPLLTDRLRPAAARWVVIVGLVIALAVTIWLTVESLRSGIHSFQSGEFRFGLARVPVWPAKLFVPLALAVFALALAMRLIRTIDPRPKRTISARAEAGGGS